ncbi:MAG: SMI1/KNR4 family protein [Ktedonobacteraceae bacterium]|nr:SMI1/KNR4 family protein [Ktedonobacteraceae bacterium]
MYLTMAKKRKEESLLLRDEHSVGCNQKEIEEIELFMKSRLPQAYQEFLLWMGHSCGRFLQGSDCFYPILKDLQQYARELLSEDHYAGKLSEDAFIFFMHQGYYFLFFHLTEGDDPPIYSYLENTTQPDQSTIVKEYSHLNDFLLAEMETYIQVGKEIIQQNADIKKINPQLARKLEALDRSLGATDSNTESRS